MSKKIKVLWLSTPLTSRYGVMNIIRGWASRFNFDEFDVVFAHYSPDPGELKARLADFPQLKLRFVPELAAARSCYVPGLRALIQLMQREQTDVVHTIFVQADILGTLAARWTCVPVVVSSVMGYLVVPLKHAGIKMVIYKAAYRLIRDRIDRLLTITRTTGKELRRDFGIDAARIQVVYSGVDQAVRPRPRHGPGEYRIGAVGQLIPQKGVETVVRALGRLVREFPKLKLLIAGEGPERDGLEQMAADLGVADRVEFLGFVEDVPSLMAQLDAFVFASYPTYDGLPRVILEAMVQGTPVVASRTEPIQEIVIEGQTGWLYTPGDAEELAAILRGLFGPALATAQVVGRASDLVKTITIENEVEQIQTVYRDLLRLKGRRAVSRVSLEPAQGRDCGGLAGPRSL